MFNFSSRPIEKTYLIFLLSIITIYNKQLLIIYSNNLNLCSFVKIVEMIDNNFIAVSFTSSGYIDITYNLILSIKKNNVPINLKLYCLDIESFNFFQEINQETIFIDNEKSFSSSLMKQSDSNFGELMLKNFTLFIKIYSKIVMFYILMDDIVLKRFY